MSSVETRNVSRDSLFLFADLRFDGHPEELRVKVRNVSAGGMMVEGGRAVTSGERITAVLRNVGEVRGTVAWVQGNRFGVAFEEPVDAKAVRAPLVPGQTEAPRYARPAISPQRFSDDDLQIRRL